MKYACGRIGRTFLLKFEDGDAVLEELAAFSRKEKVRSGALVFLGALRQGKLVTGPKKPVVPPQPNFVDFKGGWEVMGVGTIFTNRRGPQVHLHTAMGKRLKALTGCVRKECEVFLVVEAILFELKGIKASKDIDPATGINLLKIITA